MEPVRSPRNPRIAAVGRLSRAKHRTQTGTTLIEGPHMLEEAIAAGVVIREVFVVADDDRSRSLVESTGTVLTVVTPEVLSTIAQTVNPRGPVAVVEIPNGHLDDDNRDILWCDVADPGNTGTLIRTAAAFALDVVVPVGAADPWAPKTLRAGAGAHFRTVIGRSLPGDTGRLALVPRMGRAIDETIQHLDPSRRWALLVGSEAHGLADEVIDSSDLVVTISMPGGVESLNASVAGAVAAYELSRWRRSGELVSPVQATTEATQSEAESMQGHLDT